MTDVTKFISGCMASLSAMIQLELPHINILSKMDLVSNKKDIEEWAILPFSALHHGSPFEFIWTNMFCTFTGLSFLNPEPRFLLSELNQRMAPQFAKLNKALIELVSNWVSLRYISL